MRSNLIQPRKRIARSSPTRKGHDRPARDVAPPCHGQEAIRSKNGRCLFKGGISAVFITFCVSFPAHGQTTPALKALADRYWEQYLEAHPTQATALGDYRFNDRLEDLSEAARLERERSLRALLNQLRRLQTYKIPPEDRLTRKLLERTIRDSLQRMECNAHLMPLDPLYGPHLQLPLMLVSQPFRNVQDYRDYVARLRAFPKQVLAMIDNMRLGIDRGWVMPAVIVDKVIAQVRTQISADVEHSVFYEPVAKATVLDAGDREAVARDIADAIAGDVMPAYLQLLGFVEDEYRPVARSTIGICALPNGEAVYRSLAALHTTVPMEPDEIHAIGLAEVERIRGQMAAIQREVGYEGTLDGFLAHMRADAKHRFKSREAILAAAERTLQRTKPLMPRLFGRLPKADCVVKEIESFRAPAAPVAYYNVPPEDGSRPGYFYVNTYAPQERLRFTMEALTYHEAIPGHHLQMALDQENEAIPKFRRYGRYTAYVEGWALYAEKLGYEIGGYQGPYTRFGQLTFEMWRACRLVVDTGIHLKGWSRQQAIDFMTTNTSLAPIDIAAEVDRYTAWPGQALAYKIGERRMLELRRKAEQTLGERFDLRAFHDALLSGGAMPIDVLEERMNGWIDRQTAP